MPHLPRHILIFQNLSSSPGLSGHGAQAFVFLIA